MWEGEGVNTRYEQGSYHTPSKIVNTTNRLIGSLIKQLVPTLALCGETLIARGGSGPLMTLQIQNCGVQ